MVITTMRKSIMVGSVLFLAVICARWTGAGCLLFDYSFPIVMVIPRAFATLSACSKVISFFPVSQNEIVLLVNPTIRANSSCVIFRLIRSFFIISPNVISSTCIPLSVLIQYVVYEYMLLWHVSQQTRCNTIFERRTDIGTVK